MGHLPREVLRASRRPGHHHRQREIQVPRGPLPAFLPWNGGLRDPRDHLQLHQEGPVRQHCHVWRHHHVPWYCRQNAEGDHRSCSLHLRGSTPSGSEDPSWPPSPPSSRCGSPSRSTTSAAPPSSTASASKCFCSCCLFNQIFLLISI